jgi:IclR family acetate operon transcriptional repressor
MGRADVQAVDRLAMILNHLTAHRGARITDLSLATGLPLSTVHRLLRSLRKHGLVDQHPGTRAYVPGLRLFDWGHAAVSSRRLRELSRSALQRLSDETGYPTIVGLLDGGDVLIVEWLPGHKYLRREATGERWPLHVSGMGWAILAAWPPERTDEYLRRMLAGPTPLGVPTTMEQCRRLLATVTARGYAAVDSMVHAGCRSLGAAVRGTDGAVLGALGAGGPMRRLPDDLVPAVGGRLAECAEEISMSLGFVASRPAGALIGSTRSDAARS